MDQVLLPYLNATDESGRERLLDLLVVFHAAPVVRQTLRQRLWFHLNQTGKNRKNQDAEDLYQDIVTKITQVLRDLVETPPKPEIRNFRHYVARIATNACHDFLRTRSPTKFRLKHNVRDIFSRHEDFAIWKDGDATVGGFTVWKTGNRSPASKRQMQELERHIITFRADAFPIEDITKVPLTRIVAEVLSWIDRPIAIDALAETVALLLGVDYGDDWISNDGTTESELQLADEALSAQSKLEGTALVQRLWQIVMTLPSEQRDTFFFGFEDDRGADLFILLIETGVADFRQIAEVIGRPLQQVLSLRSQMPIDDAAIGAELSAPRSQVIKWRFQAVCRLRERLLP